MTLWKQLAEASGSRTQPATSEMPPAGFEDRDDHRTACASVITYLRIVDMNLTFNSGRRAGAGETEALPPAL